MGLREVLRVLFRPLRRKVPAGGPPRRREDPGGAGVREPRRPRPPGPVSGAAAAEPPAPAQHVKLADPRR
ncbi:MULTISPECIES: hypothetical protein [unclassified Crossiella]|uniref:hypothetical protein n=1 Tax=Crossiella sp. SN42 TaxID=2944808 RepID=UPI00207D33BB|nr:hypothetical protein [Crossiella sp. SN42]MCO1577648.1 hypothetical protein [Crossiella sp. SN42]